MADSEKIDLLRICAEGKLKRRITAYLNKCKKKNEIPNVAGFCIHCGNGKDDLEEVKIKFPREYDLICTYLEDKALNADAPAALITPYLKQYFGYGKDDDSDEDREIIVKFEHDIYKDGS